MQGPGIKSRRQARKAAVRGGRCGRLRGCACTRPWFGSQRSEYLQRAADGLHLRATRQLRRGGRRRATYDSELGRG
eukprot:2301582-Prymnesium_polylepis.1